MASHLVQLVPRLMRHIAAELRSSGHLTMPAHFGVLYEVSQAGPLSLSELAERQVVSRPTMSKLIAGLVGRGWLRRRRSRQDQRRVLVALTPAGRDVLTELRQQAESSLVGLLASLDPDQCAVLYDGLIVLGSALQSTGEPMPDSAFETDSDNTKRT